MENRTEDDLCLMINGLDGSIRSAKRINKLGYAVAGGMRDEKTPFESKNRTKMHHHSILLRMRMRNNFTSKFGPVSYAMSYRKKVIFLTFPFLDGILQVTCERDANYEDIARKILKIIKHSVIVPVK